MKTTRTIEKFRNVQILSEKRIYSLACSLSGDRMLSDQSLHADHQLLQPPKTYWLDEICITCFRERIYRLSGWMIDWRSRRRWSYTLQGHCFARHFPVLWRLLQRILVLHPMARTVIHSAQYRCASKNGRNIIMRFSTAAKSEEKKWWFLRDSGNILLQSRDCKRNVVQPA